MASIGSISVNLDMRTKKFDDGAEHARKQLDDMVKRAEMLSKIELFTGAGRSMVQFVSAMHDRSKELVKLGAEESRLTQRQINSLQHANDAWERINDTIQRVRDNIVRLGFPEVMKIVEGLAYAFGYVDSTSPARDAYFKVLESMTSRDYERFKKDFSGDPDYAMSAYLGIHSLDTFDNSSMEEAIKLHGNRRSPTDTSAWTAMQMGRGMVDFILEGIQKADFSPVGLSLAEIHRMQSAVNQAVLMEQPQRRAKALGMDDQGYAALEKGTAAAFSQERRSQQVSHHVKLIQDQLNTQQSMNKHLENLDRNLENMQVLEAANFTA